MNLKKKIIVLLSLILLIWWWVLWFYFKDLIVSKVFNGSSNLSFNDAYSNLVDWFTKWSLSDLKLLSNYKDIKENIDINFDWSFGLITWEANINLNWVYSNNEKISDSKWKYDLKLDWSVSWLWWELLPTIFSWNLNFIFNEWKIFWNILNFNISSTNPMIQWYAGFVQPYLSKWILLLDYLNVEWLSSSWINSFQTKDVYTFIFDMFDWFKKYPFQKQIGGSYKDWAYTVYNTDIDNDNIIKFYKQIVSSKFVSGVYGIDEATIQSSEKDLREVLSWSKLTWKLKIKNKNDIVFSFDQISLPDVVFSWDIYKSWEESWLLFTFLNANSKSSKIVLSIKTKWNNILVSLIFYENDMNLWNVSMSFDTKIDDKNSDVNVKINWNVDMFKFNMNITEKVENLVDWLSEEVKSPADFIDLKNLF